MDFGFAAGAMHLPAESYHRLGYQLQLGFEGEKGTVWTLSVEGAQPNVVTGYREYLGSLSFAAKFIPDTGFFRPFASLGAGLYLNRTNRQNGFVPSLYTSAGIRMGGSGFGFNLEIQTYLGMYNPLQLAILTAWPLVTGFGGLYIVL